jgi:hypothetical protein
LVNSSRAARGTWDAARERRWPLLTLGVAVEETSGQRCRYEAPLPRS